MWTLKWQATNRRWLGESRSPHPWRLSEHSKLTWTTPATNLSTGSTATFGTTRARDGSPACGKQDGGRKARRGLIPTIPEFWEKDHSLSYTLMTRIAALRIERYSA